MVTPPAASQLSHAQGGRVDPLGKPLGQYPYNLEEFVTPAFRALDEGMKTYWSGIRVPTKDSYRFMRVKIAGGSKSLLVWSDELSNGRVRLPVASLNRTSFDANPEKFSPPYLAMTGRYLSNRRDQIAKVFRPVPFLVKYGMTIWTEHKRDVEYIIYQVLTRFNPMAEFVLNDGHLIGSVPLRYDGAADASDKEVGSDQKAKVRYEVNMTAEAWLPLPEVVVPTIMGHVRALRETSGTILQSAFGNLITE
jgi:hypothetical protein